MEALATVCLASNSIVACCQDVYYWRWTCYLQRSALPERAAPGHVPPADALRPAACCWLPQPDQPGPAQVRDPIYTSNSQSDSYCIPILQSSREAIMKQKCSCTGVVNEETLAELALGLTNLAALNLADIKQVGALCLECILEAYVKGRAFLNLELSLLLCAPGCKARHAYGKLRKLPCICHREMNWFVSVPILLCKLFSCHQIGQAELRVCARFPALVRLDLTCCGRVDAALVSDVLDGLGIEVALPDGHRSPPRTPCKPRAFPAPSGTLLPVRLLA